MIQKLVCENCGHVEETSEVFFTDESLKCPICGYKRQIIEVKNVQEIWKELVNELGIEGALELVEDRKEYNMDLWNYLKYLKLVKK